VEKPLVKFLREPKEQKVLNLLPEVEIEIKGLKVESKLAKKG